MSGGEKNTAFLNRGDGTFATISGLSGFDFADDARAVATTDWDRDGLLDFFTANRSVPRLRFFHNEHAPAKNWIAFELTGARPINADAVGSRLTLRTGEAKPQSRTLRAGAGYLTQSERRLHFGLADASETTGGKLRWPDGTEFHLPKLAANNTYKVTYPDKLEKLTEAKSKLKWKAGQELTGKEFSGRGKWLLPYPIPLPEIQPLDEKGNPSPLRPLDRGELRLLCLWDPDCSLCLKASHELAQNQAELQKLGIDPQFVLGPTGGSIAKGRKLLREAEPNWTLKRLSENDTQLIQKSFSLIHRVDRDLPLPVSIVIDESQSIVAAYQGAIPVDQLLEDIPLLQQAADSRDPLDRAQIFFPEGRWISLRRNVNFFAIPHTLLTQKRVADAAYFVRRHGALIEPHAEYARYLTWIGDAKVAANELAEAFTFYRSALEHCRNDHLVMNNIAWQLATQKNPAFRDIKEAIRWSIKAIELFPREPSYYDTLATALAANGNFEQALKVVEKGLTLAKDSGNDALVRELQRKRGIYLQTNASKK